MASSFRLGRVRPASAGGRAGRLRRAGSRAAVGAPRPVGGAAERPDVAVVARRALGAGVVPLERRRAGAEVPDLPVVTVAGVADPAAAAVGRTVVVAGQVAAGVVVGVRVDDL